MKKLFTLAIMILALPLGLFAQTSTVILDKEWTCSNDWSSGSQQIAPSVLTDLAEDDKLEVVVTSVNTPASNWPQILLQYVDASGKWQNWGDSDPHSAGLWDASTFPYTATITFTKQMVEDIKAGKSLVIGGMGYTATKATFLHYDPMPEGVIWQGEKVMPSSWGAWQQIPASKFADAKVGDTMRLLIKDAGAGATGQLSSTSWKALASNTCGSRFCDFTLTQSLLDEIQKNGVIVNGCSYTLVGIKIFDPATVVSYTSSINISQPDWTWTDTKPVVGVNVTNPTAAQVVIPVELELSTDHGVFVKTYSQNVTLSANEKDHAVSFTLDDVNDPGIYRFSVYVNDEAVSYTRPEDKAYTWTSLNIAYKPTEISSPADAQADFAEYWQAAKEQLKGVDMNAQLELVTAGKYRNLYRVTLSSIPNGTSGDPVLIRGYYAEPVGDGTYPCVITYQGYDSDGTSSVWHFTADSNPTYAELIISARGQSFGNRAPYKDDNIYCETAGKDEKDFNISGGHWFTYHFGNKDSYYYRGAYMDQIRGIDFVCSREKIDKSNIFCTGGSQGGAFTIVAAALSDGRVNAIAPAIQFMGDFHDYFQVGTWPGYEAKNAAKMQGISDDEMYKFLSYYDTKNFASMITAPTLSSIGLQDNVCPAHTNLAPYNLITCEKVLYVNKNLVHETPSKNTWSAANNSDRDWTELTTNWWTSHMQSSGIESVDSSESTVRSSAVYNLAGQRIGNDAKGIVVMNGKKQLK